MTAPAAWVCLIAVVLGAVVAVRWWRRRVDSLGRRTPFPYISAALCLLVALGTGVPAYRLHRLDVTLSAAGSHLAGRDMDVHCQTLTESSLDAGGDLGYVAYGPDGVPGNRAVIDRDQCGDLRSWLRKDGAGASLEEITAVHILAHEAMHVAGETDEAKTECRAMQRDAELAQLLGAKPVDADALAKRYYREQYPRLQDTYRNGACVRGGSLDEHRPGPPW